MQKFLQIILLVCVVLSATGYGVFTYVIPEHYTHALPLAMLVVAGITSLAHYFLTEAVQKRKQREFNNLFISVTGLKLMFYLFGIVIYVVLNTGNAKIFLITFLILYFIFTTLEVVSIMSHIKRFRNK